MHLFVDNLTNVDFSYLDYQRGLVGETWLASAALNGALDSQGMVCDFGVVKKTLRHWLDAELDHRLLVPIRSPHVQLQRNGGQIKVSWQYAGGEQLEVSGPEQAFAVVEAKEINTNSVAQWCVAQLDEVFAASVDQFVLSFSVEEIAEAFYHYSHGLKKHAGNCQRIAHGHRSRIRIEIDGCRSPQWERNWASRWKDIYLGSRVDLQRQTEDTLEFAYRAQQGDFALRLPARCCELLECDTTVEQLAQYIANTLAAVLPGQQVQVRAYEGLGKGAVASAGKTAE
ncbi:MAG: 6-carboxytetrahydropterin synthase [Gammaproteobacteria bacterium]|nr:6-carboxytetrahydropterin synthase [Gammaproteobacteria bacterium]